MPRSLLLALAVALAAPAFAAGNDLRRKYEEQLKQFEEQIKKADDAEAKQELEKARDEYKKAMDGPLKKADAEAPKPPPPRPNPFGGNRDFQEIDDLQRQLELVQRQLADDLKRLNPRFDPNAPGLPFPVLEPKDIDDLFKELLDPNAKAGGLFAPVGPRAQAQPRLGVRVEKVPAVLAEQLELPRDGGVVVVEVLAGGAADKGGLKKNDVLLKLGGQDVPADPAAFTALVGRLPAGEKVDAEVVRKGKRETVKGIEPADAVKRLVAPNPFRGGENEQVQIQVTNGELTLHATVNGTDYAVSGSVDGGKVVPGKVTVGAGKEAKEYDALDKMPDADRAVIERLLGKVRVRK